MICPTRVENNLKIALDIQRKFTVKLSASVCAIAVTLAVTQVGEGRGADATGLYLPVRVSTCR